MIDVSISRLYKEVLKELKTKQRKVAPFLNRRYFGHDDPSLQVPVPVMRAIAKKFAKRHSEMSIDQLVALVDFLFEGSFDEEKRFAGLLLQYYPNRRDQIKPERLNFWLDHLNGWCQIDSLCQSTFTAEDMLSHWGDWRKNILKLSRDSNINKRRASLVLLTGPVRQSVDDRFSKLSFFLLKRLKEERDVLITKPISWLLRSLTKYHREKVISFLISYGLKLPSIAVRETRRKLETGKK